MNINIFINITQTFIYIFINGVWQHIFTARDVSASVVGDLFIDSLLNSLLKKYFFYFLIIN